MTRGLRRETLLAWFTEPERANWLYGDLLEEAAARGKMWFIAQYARTLAELFWRTFRSHPLQVLAMAAVLHVCGLLIQLVFYTATRNSMPITAFAYPAYMGDNMLVTFIALKLYEAFGFFLSGLLLGALSRHSVTGIVFHFLTWGLFWLGGYTWSWIVRGMPTELYCLLLVQFPIWYGAMLCGSRCTGPRIFRART